MTVMIYFGRWASADQEELSGDCAGALPGTMSGWQTMTPQAAT